MFKYLFQSHHLIATEKNICILAIKLYYEFIVRSYITNSLILYQEFRELSRKIQRRNTFTQMFDEITTFLVKKSSIEREQIKRLRKQSESSASFFSSRYLHNASCTRFTMYDISLVCKVCTAVSRKGRHICWSWCSKTFLPVVPLHIPV